MECFYKRDLKKSFMVLEGAFEELGYEKEVLKNNEISVLVSFYTVDVNNKTQIWYDISGMISLKDYFKQQGIQKDVIRKVILYIKIACEELEKYLINLKYIMFTIDMIYVIRNHNEWKVMFVYCPSDEDVIGIESVFEFLMSNANPGEIMDMCFELYDRYMKGESLEQLIQFIDEIDEEERVESVAKITDEKEVLSESKIINEQDIRLYDENNSFLYDESEYEENEDVITKLKNFLIKFIGRKKEEALNKMRVLFPKKEKSEDFEYEPDIEIYEPTVVLKPKENDYEGKLEYIGDKKESNYYISKDEFNIGSSSEGNDAILHSPVVSRFHAKIFREGNSFFIEDLNSTNGTFVNGELLSYKEKKELFQKDKIMFADVCYRIV